jgi:hypothetical protein
MAAIPTQVSDLLHNLTANFPVILGKNLVGIYLYGSLTQRAFNPKRSDVDCIVVTERNLSDAQFRQLDAWLARLAKSNLWTSRLQMSFLTKKNLFTENRRACLYQFGILTRSGSDGNSIIWRNILESGVVLFGARPETFVPAITPEMLLLSVERELGYLREEITNSKGNWRDVPFYRAYAVLTLCRILYTFKKGAVVSKPVAARWALKHVPNEFHKLIRQAVEFCATHDVRRDNAKRAVGISLSRIEQFIEFAEAELHYA